jgi:hypothetical protein
MMEVYDDLAGTNSETPNKILLLGQPGIGKRAFLNYALYRCIKDGLPVISETRQKRFGFEFHPDLPEEEPIVSSNIRRKTSEDVKIVLHQHHPYTEPSLPPPSSLLVAPVPPDPTYYKEFRKDRCISLWVPNTSVAEIQAMNSALSGLSLPALERRIARYGPSPLLVFSPRQSRQELELEMEIRNWAWGPKFQQILNSGQLNSDIGFPNPYSRTGWILHVDTRPGSNSGVSKVRWASDYIRERAFYHAFCSNRRGIDDYIANILSSPSLYGPSPKSEYSLWASFVLAEGLPSDLREEYVIKMRGEDRRGWGKVDCERRNKDKANEEEKGNVSNKDEGEKVVEEEEEEEHEDDDYEAEEVASEAPYVTRVDSLLSLSALLRNPGHVCFTKNSETDASLFDAGILIKNQLYLFKVVTEKRTPIPWEDLKRWIRDVHAENTRRSFEGNPGGKNDSAICEVVPTLVTPQDGPSWLGSFWTPEELLRSPEDLEIRFSVCHLSPVAGNS